MSGRDPLRRGEVRFGVQKHVGWLRRGWRAFERLPHLVQVLLMNLGPLLIVMAVVWVIWLFTPTKTIPIPAAPNPPGYYAVVATSQPSSTQPGKVEVEYAGFVGERVQFVSVKSVDDIPASVRAVAEVVQPGASSHVTNTHAIFENLTGLSVLLKIASHFTVQDGQVRATGDLNPLASGEQQLKPYILHGDVDVDCGDLRQNDQGFAKMFVNESSLKAASIDLRTGFIRGPPYAVRTVYVVGKVKSVHGPEQFGSSRFNAEVLDLRADPIQLKAFEVALDAWNSAIGEMTRTYDVPELELRMREGANFQKKGGVVSGVNARGETEEIKTNTQRESETRDSIRRAGASEEGSGKSGGWFESVRGGAVEP